MTTKETIDDIKGIIEGAKKNDQTHIHMFVANINDIVKTILESEGFTFQKVSLQVDKKQTSLYKISW